MRIMKGFESTSIHSKESTPSVFKNEREHEIMVPAYEKALAIIENESISPDSFRDTYNSDLLARHAKYVEEREADFVEERRSNEKWARAEVFGKTLEAILHHQINEGIYGEDVRGVCTAPYDDYHAGIDEVIERNGPDGTSYIGCAIDFTFGNPAKKIERIEKEIEKGRLKEIFYYESPFGDPPHIHGKLQGIPKVVVGMDTSHLLQLAQQWIESDEEALQKNQLFLCLLRQIQIQSEVFHTIAQKRSQKEVANRYKQIHASISRLYTEQKSLMQVSMLDSDVTDDAVHQEIVRQMHELATRT